MMSVSIRLLKNVALIVGVLLLQNSSGVLIYVDTDKTFFEARQSCQSIGNTYGLAKIDSTAKYNEMVNLVQSQSNLKDFWIGLTLDTSRLPSYIYIHEDGTVATYFTWYSGEPNYQESDLCIRVERINFQFRTMKCIRKYHFICEDIHGTDSSTLMTTPTTATFTKTQASRTSDVGNVQTTTQNYNLEGTSTQNVHNHATNMVDNLTFPSELNSVLMSTTTPCSLYLSLCNCTYLNSNDPSFAEKLTKKLLDIKKNLTLPKGILTRQRRRLTSADDNRMSSTYVGLGGIIVLSIVLASLVFPDAINLCSWILDNRAEN